MPRTALIRPAIDQLHYELQKYLREGVAAEAGASMLIDVSSATASRTRVINIGIIPNTRVPFAKLWRRRPLSEISLRCSAPCNTSPALRPLLARNCNRNPRRRHSLSRLWGPAIHRFWNSGL